MLKIQNTTMEEVVGEECVDPAVEYVAIISVGSVDSAAEEAHLAQSWPSPWLSTRSHPFW